MLPLSDDYSKYSSKLSIPRTIGDLGSRLPIDRMTTTIHVYKEGYDPTKNSKYMNHCDQLGFTKDKYDDENKHHKITDIQIPTVLEEVLNPILKLSSVMDESTCMDLFKVLTSFWDDVADTIRRRPTVQMLASLGALISTRRIESRIQESSVHL